MTKHKYGAVKTVIDGITFASKAEGRRYVELRKREQAGEIMRLQLQPRYELQEAFTDALGVKHRAINYVADFAYFEHGAVVVEDVKGVETPEFRIKAKLFRYRYRGTELRIVK